MKRWVIAIMLIATTSLGHGWPNEGGGSATIVGPGGEFTRTGTVVHPTLGGDELADDATGTDWIISDTGAAVFETSVTAGPNSDPADTGEIRFNNNSAICWEASAAGTDVCLKVDTEETFRLSDGLLVPTTGATALITCAAGIEGAIYYDTTLSMMCVCSDRSTAYIWESFDNTVEGTNADCG